MIMRVQWEKLAWIALAIVLIVVGCGSEVAQSPTTAAPTPVPPTQTSEPTAVPPTQTPAPTAVPPTQTPAPTAVPPTQTPAPTATAEALPFPVDGIFAKGSLTWEFKPDGTYVTEGHTQLMNAKFSGIYTVTGDQVVVQDDYTPCKDVVGIYAWTYDGEVLTLTKVDDKCRDRAGIAWGKWRKKP
jgi:cytoskeletal protein RodZ